MKSKRERERDGEREKERENGECGDLVPRRIRLKSTIRKPSGWDSDGIRMGNLMGDEKTKTEIKTREKTKKGKRRKLFGAPEAIETIARLLQDVRGQRPVDGGRRRRRRRRRAGAGIFEDFVRRSGRLVEDVRRHTRRLQDAVARRRSRTDAAAAGRGRNRRRRRRPRRETRRQRVLQAAQRRSRHSLGRRRHLRHGRWTVGVGRRRGLGDAVVAGAAHVFFIWFALNFTEMSRISLFSLVVRNFGSGITLK